MRKHRDINFLTSEATSNYLSSEPNSKLKYLKVIQTTQRIKLSQLLKFK